MACSFAACMLLQLVVLFASIVSLADATNEPACPTSAQVSLLQRAVTLEPSTRSLQKLEERRLSTSNAVGHRNVINLLSEASQKDTPGASRFVDMLSVRAKPSDGITVDATYSSLWEEVQTFPERKPRIFNVLLATTKTFLADLVVQISQARGMVIDWKRSAAFAAFGCLYVGCIQWIWYVTLFTWMCPGAIRFANEPWSSKLHDYAGQWDLITQVCMDNFFLAVFIYFPVFYATKEAIQEGTDGTLRGLISTARNGFAKYRRNCWVDLPMMWSVWVLADLLIYSVPMFMRLPMDHTISIIWTMMLSLMRGASKETASSATAKHQKPELVEALANERDPVPHPRP